MNKLIRSLLLTFLIFCSGEILPQGVLSSLDEVYGPDMILFNGRKYSYFLPPGTGGNQFFLSSDFLPGTVVIKWKGDKEISFNSAESGRHGGMGFFLNYDIYNQKLLLKYYNETGAEEILEVSEAWLDSFTLGLYHFRYYRNDDVSKIYQALGDGKFQVFYAWRKSLKLSNSTGTPNYAFSIPAKSRFVNKEGEIIPFSANGSFIKIFDPRFKDRIRDYMKQHGISVKKASDREITDLINYISNLD